VIEARLKEFDNDPSKVNFQLLVDNVERVVMEGRSCLTRFRSESVGPLSEFLDKCLPSDVLRIRLEDGLRVVVTCSPRARRAAAYDLIQKEQASLQKKVRSLLAAIRH